MEQAQGRTSSENECNDCLLNKTTNDASEEVVVGVQPTARSSSRAKAQANYAKGEKRITCCGVSDPEGKLVDLCPKSWFEGGSESILWRICFVTCCLPLCYPCYLTRTLRRAPKATKSPVGMWDNGFNKGDILDRTFDPMSRMLHKQLTDDAGQKLEGEQQRISINVIVLKSESNQVLLSALSANLPYKRGTTFLRAVKEENEDEDEHVPLRRKTVNFSQSVALQERRQKQTASTSRWQRMKTLSKVTMRFSRASRNSKKLNAGGDVPDGPSASSKSINSTTSSLYYSFESESEDEPEAEPEKMVEVSDLGQRLERVVGHNVSFAIFDEGSVAEWKGQNLKVAKKIPNIDVLVMAVDKGNVEDIDKVLEADCGLVHYVTSFWRGFYPLLLVELDDDHDRESLEDYEEKLDQLIARFGDVHHISLPTSMVSSNVDWLHGCLARLYIHSRVFQCSRFFGRKVNGLDRCPGGCDLSKSRPSTESNFAKKKKRRISLRKSLRSVRR